MLKLGVPSKGRLMEDTFRWFGERGITLSRSGSDREYAGRVEGADLALVLLSASEIPRELASGNIFRWLARSVSPLLVMSAIASAVRFATVPSVAP